MTLNELMEKILKILPDATIGQGSDGQLWIYTGLMIAEKLPPAGLTLARWPDGSVIFDKNTEINPE